jgi:hypothetical protein
MLGGDGTQRWLTSIGGVSEDEGAEATVGPDGRVSLCGSYRRSVTVGTSTLTAAGGSDFLIASVSPDGRAEWAASPAGGSQDDVCYAVEVDAADRTVFSGFFRGSATFGPTSFTSAGQDDAVYGVVRAP